VIERAFAFCFGSQRHKYVVLLLATVLAGTVTVAIGGIEHGPTNAPIIAVLALLLAIPISALLHTITAERGNLAISRRIARRASLRIATDDSLLADLEEFYADVRTRFGVRRANTWYRFQALAALVHSFIPNVRPLVWRFAGLMAVGLLALQIAEGHVTITQLSELFHDVTFGFFVAAELFAVLLAAIAEADYHFDEFRNRKRAKTDD